MDSLKFLYQPQHAGQMLLTYGGFSFVFFRFNPEFTDVDISCATLPGKAVFCRFFVEVSKFASGILKHLVRVFFVSSVQRILAAYIEVETGTDHAQHNFRRIRLLQSGSRKRLRFGLSVPLFVFGPGFYRLRLINLSLLT